MNKQTLLIIGVIVAILLVFAQATISIQNRAISAEEQIYEANSGLQVQQKRRVDLIYNLVDTVEAYAQYEQETLELIISARENANSGSIDNAQLMLAAVAEAYPELKANENYKQLMTELALTENKMAQYRENYNIQVKNYKKLVRKFPNSLGLALVGYEVLNFEYLEFDAPVDAAQDLFGGN